MRHLAPLFAPTTDPEALAAQLRMESEWAACPHSRWAQPFNFFIRAIEQCSACFMLRVPGNVGAICRHIELEYVPFELRGTFGDASWTINVVQHPTEPWTPVVRRKVA